MQSEINEDITKEVRELNNMLSDFISRVEPILEQLTEQITKQSQPLKFGREVRNVKFDPEKNCYVD